MGRDAGDGSQQNPVCIGKNVPAHFPPEFSDKDKALFNECQTDVDYYNLFNPSSFLNYTLHQTKKYASSKRWTEQHMRNITANNIWYVNDLILTLIFFSQ